MQNEILFKGKTDTMVDIGNIMFLILIYLIMQTLCVIYTPIFIK